MNKAQDKLFEKLRLLLTEGSKTELQEYCDDCVFIQEFIKYENPKYGKDLPYEILGLSIQIIEFQIKEVEETE